MVAPYDCKYVAIQILDVGTSPKDFTIDYSPDGTTWTTVVTVANASWSMDYETKYYDIPVGSQSPRLYWRVNITANMGNLSYKTIGRIKFIDQYGNFPRSPKWPYSHFDIIPPISETIGDSATTELVRFCFQAALGWTSQLGICGVLQSNQDVPGSVSIGENANSSGSKQLSVTLVDTSNKEPISETTLCIEPVQVAIFPL